MADRIRLLNPLGAPSPHRGSRRTRVWTIALAAVGLTACAGGGGEGDPARAALAPAVAGPGQVLVDAQLLDAAGAPLAGLACRLDPLAPSALHAGILGLETRESVTDATGRVAFVLPLGEVLGAYGGRFYRLTAADAAGPLLTADVFADASGARIGQVRCWSGQVRVAPADTTGGVEVAWSAGGLAEVGAVLGFQPRLLSAAGDPVAEALVTGFADRFRFDAAAVRGGGAGSQSVGGAGAPATARVRAHVARNLPSGQAFLAIESDAAPIAQP